MRVRERCVRAGFFVAGLRAKLTTRRAGKGDTRAPAAQGAAHHRAFTGVEAGCTGRTRSGPGGAEGIGSAREARAGDGARRIRIVPTRVAAHTGCRARAAPRPSGAGQASGDTACPLRGTRGPGHAGSAGGRAGCAPLAKQAASPCTGAAILAGGAGGARKRRRCAANGGIAAYCTVAANVEGIILPYAAYHRR